MSQNVSKCLKCLIVLQIVSQNVVKCCKTSKLFHRRLNMSHNVTCSVSQNVSIVSHSVTDNMSYNVAKCLKLSYNIPKGG